MTMKGPLACLFALALATKTSASNNDPSQAAAICAAEGSDGTLVAHEACNQFYKCSEGKPVAMDCPENLLWNANLNYCDWPANVNCDSEIPKKVNVVNSYDIKLTINTDPSKAPEICSQDGSDGVLVAHEECDKFYKCSEGVPFVLNCYSGLLWNAEKEYCDWPDNVKCASHNEGSAVPTESPAVDSPNGGGNSDPSKAPEICAADDSDGVLVAHEECDKFYKCLEGKPVALSCPASLQWNSDKAICDWPENVNCIPVAFECPDNLLYNPDKKICDCMA